jgi:hypothetical protein
MPYDAAFVPEAEDELIELWLNASDRHSVTRAAHYVDLLQSDPYRGQ